MSSGVNMLTNSLKISDTTKTEFFELIFFQSGQKIWKKYCRADLGSPSDLLICWLSVSVLTRGFLGIYFYSFRKKSPLRLIYFFFKYSQLDADSKN